jgi:cell division protein FtsL
VLIVKIVMIHVILAEMLFIYFCPVVTTLVSVFLVVYLAYNTHQRENSVTTAHKEIKEKHR